MLQKFLILMTVLLYSCANHTYKNPRIEIQTRAGNIEVELYADKAPKTVAAFLSYVDSNFFENTSFYRILNRDNQPSDAFKTELIQGGVWNKKKLNVAGIPHEPTNQTGILHKDGVISLARLAPGTASTEFFICIGDQPGLDYGGNNNEDKQGYAAFGKVVKGMNVVRNIYNRPESDQNFDPPIDIYKIKRL